MVYTAEYGADDITNASIDGVVKFIIVIAGFASLIALVFLLGWFTKKWKG